MVGNHTSQSVDIDKSFTGGNNQCRHRVGRSGRTRTVGLSVPNAARYQLRHTPSKPVYITVYCIKVYATIPSMIQVIISIAAAIVALIITELFAFKNVIKQELARKISHIVISASVISWVFFVNMQVILGLGLIFLAAAIVERELNIFSSARYVGRRSWGELFFPLGLVIIAFLDPSKWIFISAMLYLGAADSAAALIGKAKGKHRYFNKKSLEGSAAFFAVSVFVTVWVVLIAPTGLSGNWTAVIWLPFVATIVEALSPWGLDNLFIPVLVVAVLKLLPVAV